MTEERNEKMNELMNKISFELKDATLQQGFEIICKRISKLEKENAELHKLIKDYEDDSVEALCKVNDLKVQIKRMKCCGNCKYSFANGMGCMQGARRNSCYNYDLWESAE